MIAVTLAALRRRTDPPLLAAVPLLGLSLGLASPTGALANAPGVELSHRLSGGPARYCVVPGDTLLAIAARHAETLSRLLRDNALEPGTTLRPGRCLRIDNPHVVPDDAPDAHDAAGDAAGAAPRDGLVVSIAQRMAFRWQAGHLTGAYAVAVGRPDWPTPTGAFHVVQLRRDPVWHVPLSIQQEMQREGKPVQREVPAGPDNPLGSVWIGLSAPGYGVHGTNAPASLHSFRTHGCIRMHDADASEVFGSARLGWPVRIVYRPWLLAERPDGTLWLESDPDPYRRSSPAHSLEQLRTLAREHGLEARIDWQQALRVMDRQAGWAERVDLHGEAASAPARS